MNNQTQIYISLYNQIDELVRKMAKVDIPHSFISAVNEVAEYNPLIRQNKRLLHSLGELRNVLVHREGNINNIIAIPSDEAIQSLKNILLKIKKPTQLYKLFGNKSVIKISSKKSLLDCLSIMKNNDYSQLPVYENERFISLLTGNVISRWFSAHVTESGEIIESLENINVESVLKHKEEIDTVKFLNRFINVYDFLDIHKRSPSPSGVYIATENGHDSEKPVFMVTYFDIPTILQELEL